MTPGIRTIPFVKASACGNDFLLIDASLIPASEAQDFTRRICHRHDGVGADGVEWMLAHPTADVEIRLINADGSENPALVVFRRDGDKVRLFWASEMTR